MTEEWEFSAGCESKGVDDVGSILYVDKRGNKASWKER